MVRFFSIAALCLLTPMAIGCHNMSETPIVELTRNSAFTGCGNSNELFTQIKVSSKSGCEIRSVDVVLNAIDGDVTAVVLSCGGNIVSKLPVVSGKSKYRLKCGVKVDSVGIINVGADVAGEAIEGNHVSIDVSSVSFRGAKVFPENPEPASREILLVRKCLFMPGDYGSKNYRIPALRVLYDGSILIANDKRKYNETDLPEDIDIVSRRSTDGGHTWTEPVTIVEGRGVGKGFGDPVLVQAADGSVICAFVGGAGLWNSTPENPQRSYIVRSDDGGQTWSSPLDVTSQIWGKSAERKECRMGHSAFFGSGTGLLLTKGKHAGRIMIVSAVTTKDNRLDNYAFYSDDNGHTWTVSERAYIGGDEAKVVELADGRVLMSIRQNGKRGYNISSDGGHTWGKQQLWDDICTNACDGDIIRYDRNTLLHSVPNSMKRENVSIFVSTDEGKTWPYSKSICHYNSVYSSLAVLPDGTIAAYIEENPAGACEMWFLNFSFDWLMKK